MPATLAFAPTTRVAAAITAQMTAHMCKLGMIFGVPSNQGASLEQRASSIHGPPIVAIFSASARAYAMSDDMGGAKVTYTNSGVGIVMVTVTAILVVEEIAQFL